MTMTTTRTALRGRAVAPVLALALALPVAAAATAQAAPAASATSASASAPAAASVDAPAARPELPRPTGPFAVGRDTLHLVDKSRKDPWVPSAGARELMASMYYPARGAGGRPTAYTSEKAARELLAYYELDGRVPADGYSSTRTHARTGAHPARGTFPLVVLSPGFTAPRSTLTHLAEDLASRGYVVATVDHAYEASGAEFSGGRVLPCVGCEEGVGDSGPRITEGRARDLSYVLDRLIGGKAGKAGKAAWRYSGMIDAKRIGMGGHSIGGAATATLMGTDGRVRAGMNMDGGFHIVPKGLKRPFLLLGTESTTRPDGPYNWAEVWPGLQGWKRWLTVAGSGHYTFTDVPVVLGQLGVDEDPEAPISGERAEQITRAYIGAYFDRHLRGVGQPLLDGPTPAHPEVGFHRP
ncbi:alpha/beta hydrolase [Streptomyces aurantiacus]|uniref:Putative Platelet-activating factor acetylhydrolase n=1 Tax=Streptomyces aurantiacus JA 4570 TaxID=1286094 RepID=S3ZMC0_9ACTN|nr:putative Platelet-activating factor acetylhydrolase [Streptomyces aurantiacus]EPH43929.1 putative Platelet-activating factor acetylhydrolase [Streptomyces aurantiacus JA 4570]